MPPTPPLVRRPSWPCDLLRRTLKQFGPVGQLDYTDGLRAYMSPDENSKIWLGGKAFPSDELDFIDTDATATPYGMVFFDADHRALLLREDGTTVALAPVPDVSGAEDFRPSSKADSRLPLVAWTEPGEDGVTVRLYDLQADEEVDSTVPCSSCHDVTVDAVDNGLVFVRTHEGTVVWDPISGGNALSFLGPPDTQVADVRNQRTLHTGPAPEPGSGSPIDDSWSYTEGAIDAQLSFDGGHVLNWSTRLQPTTAAGSPIRLDVPNHTYVFVTFDTDGSVLVAVPRRLSATMYDCALPSGSCIELGNLPTESGDPIFVDNDM